MSLRGFKGTKSEIHLCVGFRGTVGRALTSPYKELILYTLRVLRITERPLKMHVSQTEPRHLSVWISDLARCFDGHDEHFGGQIYECAIDDVILNPGYLGDLQKSFATLLQEVPVRENLAWVSWETDCCG